MPSDADRQELQERAALLVGHAIRLVRYLGWWQLAPEEPGAFVEYIELTMDDGAVVQVSADDPDDLGIDGIALYEGAYPSPPTAPGAPPAEGIGVLDGRSRAGWAAVLGEVVASATIHWAIVEAVLVQAAPPAETGQMTTRGGASVTKQKVDVPAALELRFDSGRSVYLTAASWTAEGTLFSETDNVAVVFGDTEAERLRVGRWRGR